MTQTQPDAADAGASRSRTFSWSDPLTTAGAVGTETGLELLRAVADGRLPGPPIAHALGFDLVEIEKGRVVFELTAEEFHYNPIGSVHGGVLATVLDSATGCAVHSTLPAGTGYTSLDLSVRFVRGVTTASGRLRCEGTVLSGGRRTAVAEARLTDARGRLVAHATSTCLLMPLQ